MLCSPPLPARGMVGKPQIVAIPEDDGGADMEFLAICGQRGRTETLEDLGRPQELAQVWLESQGWKSSVPRTRQPAARTSWGQRSAAAPPTRTGTGAKATRVATCRAFVTRRRPERERGSNARPAAR